MADRRGIERKEEDQEQSLEAHQWWVEEEAD